MMNDVHLFSLQENEALSWMFVWIVWIKFWMYRGYGEAYE